MGERKWTAIGVVNITITMLIGLVLWLASLGLSIFVVGAAVGDLWQAKDQLASRWMEVAVLLIFTRTLLAGRRMRELERKIEHIRMTSLATTSYLDFAYGNTRLDPLGGVGKLTRHGFWRIWHRIWDKDFADDILMASFAKRGGRKVTMADDLKAAVRARDEIPNP
jgi:hypothetical protein